MRYAAVSQSRPGGPVHVLGVGESMEDALASARAWFDQQFTRTSSKEHGQLLTLQNALTIFDERDLEEKSGLGLDAWLDRMRLVGVIPPVVNARAAAIAAEEPSIWVDPPKRKDLSGNEMGFEFKAAGVFVFILLPLFEVWWGLNHFATEEGADSTLNLLRFGTAALILSASNVVVMFLILKLIFGLSMQTFIMISLGLRILTSVFMFQGGYYGQLSQLQSDLNEFDATMATVEATDYTFEDVMNDLATMEALMTPVPGETGGS